MRAEANIWIKKNLKGDPVIWSIVLLLYIFGMLVVYSAFTTFGNGELKTVLKHVFLIGLSLCTMWLCHNLNYKYYSKLSRIGLWVAAMLLLFTYLFGTSVNEASRWIKIPIIEQTFQPSDFAKLALIVNLASMLAKRQEKVEYIKKGLSQMLFWVIIICGLIALSDVSTAAQLFVTSLIVMFIGRVPLKQLGLLILTGVTALALFIVVGNRANTFKNRWNQFVQTASGTIDTKDMSTQVKQAYCAIAGGGLVGNGLGKSEEDSLIYLGFSDYIFAKITNDLGSLTAVLLVFLYLALLYRGMKVAARSEMAFGGLLSAGLSFTVVIQALVHMAVSVGLTPATGIPLPLISMGGTSLLFTGMAMGIILSVSRGERKEEEEKELDETGE